MCKRTHGRLMRWDSTQKDWVEVTGTSIQGDVPSLAIVDNKIVASTVKPTKVLRSEVRASQFENRDKGN